MIFIIDLMITILLIYMLFCAIMLIKVEVTSRNLVILLNAMYDYYQDCIERGAHDKLQFEYYDTFPPFDKVLYRLFDWGYKNILPKDIFEKIEPFIK